MKKHQCKLLSALIILLFNVGIAELQAGAIRGFVSDANGVGISGVEVRASLFLDSNYEKAITKNDGSYLIDSLSVGAYLVRVLDSNGYSGLYYNGVLDENMATTVKVGIGQTVENINFSLKEKGGYISGHIYTENSAIITTGITVGFYDTNSKDYLGHATSNSEGYYVSPALPVDREVIVRAGDSEQGYIQEYYNDVLDWDLAEVLTITVLDTITGTNFYLRKGGAISGYVFDENNPNKGLKAWVIVEDWDTKTWRSWVWSDPETGYYRAGGLPTGSYNVYVKVSESDNYHVPQYYYKRARPQNASQVDATDKDTITGINFYLVPNTHQFVENEHIDIMVSDKYPGTNLTMGTTNGLPDALLDDDKPLLFGHPEPYSSYTTIRIDDKSYKFGSNDGDFLYEDNQYNDPDYRIVPRRTADGQGVYWGWICKHIKVEQTVSIVESQWSEKRIFDTAKIKYVITNTDNVPKKVGLRILLDTMLGDNDGAPIRTPDGVFTDHERNFGSSNIPAYWTAVEGDSTQTIFSAQGTLQGYEATTPDRFAIVKWNEIFKKLWTYQTEDTCKVIYDSGVALWWEPILLDVNETREIVTYYGLGEMIPDTIPPYIYGMEPGVGDIAAPNTGVRLHVKDDYMGVDGESIQMWLNNNLVQPVLSSDGEGKDYELFFEPPTDFKYGQVCSVKIYAKDRAYIPNEMDTTYYFSILDDDTPPYLNRISPVPDTSEVPIDTKMSFYVNDEISGVDTTTLRIIVDNDTVHHQQISGNSNEYFVQFKPEQEFKYNQEITVRVLAADLADKPNQMDTTYSFSVKKDTVAPYVDQIFPGHGSKDVPISAVVQFHLKDDLAGVDSSTIVFKMNDLLFQPELSGEPGDYLVKFQPPDGFKFNQKVTIRVEAADLADPANLMERDVCTFYIIRDDEPPFFSRLHPAPGDIDVPLNTDISFHVQDGLAGVDKQTISLIINGKLIELTESIQGDPHDYYVHYTPENSFFYNDTVNLRINASDLAEPKNDTTYSYHFFVVRDTIPPYIQDLYPPSSAADVPLDTAISFTVLDDHSGVGNVQLEVDGSAVTMKRQGENGYVYKPENGFSENDTVRITIFAEDLVSPSNTVTVSDSFFTARDTLPPWTEGHSPQKNATEVPFQTAIIVHIKDVFTGVDSASIIMKIDGNRVFPTIEAEHNGYQLTYYDSDFHYNQVVNVFIYAQDLAKIPNEMTDRYNFHIIEDYESPYICNLVPAAGDTGVKRNTTISFDLKDEVAGVDSSSIITYINGMDVTSLLSIAGNKNDYQVIYQPSEIFNIGEKVTVKVWAQDHSYPPVVMDTVTYNFTITNIRDVDPPYVENCNPSPNDHYVQQDVTITFHVKDDWCGVNKNSIILRVMGDQVKPEIAGDKLDYLVSYRPVENFQVNDTVYVEIEADDLAEIPNRMDTVKYHFYIQRDTISPRIVFTKPGNAADNVPLDADIIFDVYDDQIGVDSDSILMLVNNRPVVPDLSGTKNHYTLTYHPVENFDYNQKVIIELHVQDLTTPANVTDSSFHFSTVFDTMPPYIILRKPDKDEQGVDFNTPISFHIKDDVAGVDLSSIVLKVEGEVIDNFITSGDANDCEVTYQPPEPGFVSGQVVDVEIDAKDLSNPQNIMETDNYHFTVKDILPDLTISLSVDSSKILVHHTVTLTAEITNSYAPIKTPFKVLLKNGSQPIKSEEITQVSIDEVRSLTFPLTLHDRGKCKLEVSIDAYDDVNESNEVNNFASTVINVIEGELVVRSNPFTPNDDGFNDFVGFDFKEFSLNTPILKIFNFQGRRIITLDKYENSKFVWNGKDHGGRNTQPGVYLYVLQDTKRNVARGYVVLAR